MHKPARRPKKPPFHLCSFDIEQPRPGELFVAFNRPGIGYFRRDQKLEIPVHRFEIGRSHKISEGTLRQGTTIAARIDRVFPGEGLKQAIAKGLDSR